MPFGLRPIPKIMFDCMKRDFLLLLLIIFAVTFSTPFLHAQEPETLKWKFQIDALIFSSPAIGMDGTVYIGSGLFDYSLYAVNRDGTLKWKFSAEGGVDSSPAIAKSGTVYVGSADNHVYAVNHDGTLKWKHSIGRNGSGGILSSPAISIYNIIYIGTGDIPLEVEACILALQSDGNLHWKFQAPVNYRDFDSSPAIGADGTIYIGSDDSNLYAVNPDGTLKWKYETGAIIYSSPAIDDDGTLYFGSRDHYLYALNSNGTLKWKYETGDRIQWTSPVIDFDGTIYIGSEDNYLHAVNPDGTLKWKYKTDERIRWSSPAIGADGIIYVGSNDKFLHAIKRDGTLYWKFETGDRVYPSPAIAEDGTVYFGSNDGYLYAVHSSSLGLADSSWPKFRQNNQNTGQAPDFPVSVERDETLVPGNSALAQNYPNPFNPSTSISFSLPKTGFVTLTIYDIRGRIVKHLVREQMPSGRHEVSWDGHNSAGIRVASGQYFYTLSIDGKENITRKMILLK